MIQIKKVSLSYVKGKKVIDKMSLKVENGTVFGFIGPNGAGKTTTIEMITGILNIDEGDILLDKKSIKRDPIAAKKQFGFVPDVPDAFEKLTGLEYLNFIADVYEVPTRKRLDIVKRLSEEFGIMGELKDRIQSYSHGMKQKVALISALSHNPKVLVMDEPFVGLDPKASFIVKNLMREMCEAGMAIFFSTHVLEVAEKLCNKVAIIKDGKLIISGKTEEVVGKESLEEVFLDSVDSLNNNSSVNSSSSEGNE